MVNATTAVTQTSLPFPKRQGKVRDVYDLGQELLIVSTDRVSAFDWVLPNGIPSKGVVLTALSEFWFDCIDVPNHLLSTSLPESLQLTATLRNDLAGRSMVTKNAEVVPFECVVRGYLEGSGWREYQERGTVCSVALPKGLKQCDRLPEPIFTPATKAEEGHDENVSFEYMANEIGQELAEQLRDLSLKVYADGAKLAADRGVLIADTKFEWGHYNDQLILIDEVLTPDSSRFWPADQFRPGGPQPSFDKQFIREWLQDTDWDRNSPPPALPDEIVAKTVEKYQSVCELLTGKSLSER